MSIFSDIGNALGSIAPWIVKALPLPPPLGSLAASALASVLGTGDKTPEGLQAALAGANPDQLLALKKADQDFAIQMQAMGFKQITDLEKINADDRANARAREMAVKDKTPMVLAGAITVGFFGLLAVMIFHIIPPDNKEVLDIMIGSLGTAWISVVTYYFGSSSGSAAKSKTIDKIVSNGN